MNKIAFVFPGQGSQYPGMGKDLCQSFECARSVFEEADQALDFALSRLCFDGPEEALNLTENTQPAVLTVSVAAYQALASNRVRPHFVAGHSLGEYSALVAAGSLTLAEAVRTVRNRGKYMQEAVPAGEGAMAALIGLNQDQVVAICREAAQAEVLSAANLNSPSQIVVAGTVSAVQRAVELARVRDVKKAIMLLVSAPFHCDLMRPAAQRLNVDLAKLTFRDLLFPLVNNAEAQEMSAGNQIMDSLSRQVCSPVLWTRSVQHLISRGVRLFVEVGPKRVLSGLVRQIDSTVETTNVEDERSLNETLNIIRQFG